MVSFSCENCGDVLTKKKLDTHQSRCQGASFTCLDCMVHFRGMDYKSHTSCISEAQKYQGALYKESRKSKNSKSSRSQNKRDSQALVPRQAYVEDAPDPDAGAVAIVDAPPHAPSPPPAAPAVPVSQPEQLALPPINVFDFLVTEDTPNASRVSLPSPTVQQQQQQQQQYEEGMKMVANAPAIFDPSRRRAITAAEDDEARILKEYEDKMYEAELQETRYQKGYTADVDYYTAQAQKKEGEFKREQKMQQAYLTPAPKRERELSNVRDGRDSSRGREHKSKDGKKRKRHHVEDLDLSATRSSRGDRDEVMTDAPILHSGLTGGLNRLMTGRSAIGEYPSPSPDYPDNVNGEAPMSPLKRTRHSRSETRGREKGVRDKVLALVATGTSTVSSRKSSSSTNHTTSSADRPHKKHHRHHRHRDESERSSHRSSRRGEMKAIEYHPMGSSTEEPSQNQLILYRTRAELFTSFINKGPESTAGVSMNKALKRYHRERGDRGLGLGKLEEEKELWKGLRLKRNDRGEIVLFCSSG